MADDRSRTVILMRHAKSDWSDGDLADYERPLNHRGRRDAPRMALWLADNDLMPDLILSSSSTRTRETVSLMLTAWQRDVKATYLEELYHGTPKDVIAAIGTNANAASRVMVVAHNPGMASLVSRWIGQYTDMPTAAIAVFRAACDRWKDLDAATEMTLAEYMRPKVL